MRGTSTEPEERGRGLSRNADGELEMVLGNKQLLSVFFIVVILLGVFFTLGYLVGRNSAPLIAEGSRRPEPVTTEGRASGPSALGQRVETPVETATPASPPATAPAEPQPGSAKPDALPAQDTKPAEKPLEIPAVTPGVTEPVAGQTYMQVAAVGKPEAEVLVEVLGKRGFRAIVAPGPDEKRFRVLVGPVKDLAEVGKLKGDLAQIGFAGAIIKKY